MSDIRWLRFRYKFPVECDDPEGPPGNVCGYVTYLLAIRSDGIMYESHLWTEPEPNGEKLKAIREKLRLSLEVFLTDVPRSTIIPHPDPENWMKGLLSPNGDGWVEAVQ